MSIPQAALLGDLTADLKIDGQDFVNFRTAYDDINGVGAFVAMQAAVPEPAAATLAVAALATFTAARRRRVVAHA